jgi:hypothetical protein
MAEIGRKGGEARSRRAEDAGTLAENISKDDGQQ